jgi:hypothetical protein
MRQKSVEDLYKILEKLKCSQEFQFLSKPVPTNYMCGIYFFFDKITPILSKQYKITYIGISSNNKNNRLEKHQKGNSSFRDHVKEALSNRYSSSEKCEIDDYIHHLPYLFVTIKNTEELSRIEKGTIEIISNYNKQPIHIPRKEWLGYNHKNDKIIKSHIWNIRHTGNYSDKKDYNQILMLLEEYIEKMIGQN